MAGLDLQTVAKAVRKSASCRPVPTRMQRSTNDLQPWAPSLGIGKNNKRRFVVMCAGDQVHDHAARSGHTKFIYFTFTEKVLGVRARDRFTFQCTAE